MDADTKRGAVRAAVLECCRAWEPQARVLGNVTAGELADLLEHVVTAAEKAVLDAAKVIPEEYLRRKRRSFEYIEAFDHRHARTDVVKNELSDFCDAELARREAAK